MAMRWRSVVSVIAGGALGGGVACSGGIVTLGTEADSGLGSHDAAVLDVTIERGGDAPRLDGTSQDTGTDAGPPEDASSPRCPATAPKAGSSCTTLGLECEYGSSSSIACNVVVTCTASGWSSATPPTTGPCPPPSGKCPSAYPVAKVGEACSPSGLVCSYTQGTCTCAKPIGPATTDGGTRWQCFDASPGCPTDRPLLGTSCSHAGEKCNYGECADGVEVECEDGAWQEVMAGCPASSPGGDS